MAMSDWATRLTGLETFAKRLAVVAKVENLCLDLAINAAPAAASVHAWDSNDTFVCPIRR